MVGFIWYLKKLSLITFSYLSMINANLYLFVYDFREKNHWILFLIWRDGGNVFWSTIDSKKVMSRRNDYPNEVEDMLRYQYCLIWFFILNDNIKDYVITKTSHTDVIG